MTSPRQIVAKIFPAVHTSFTPAPRLLRSFTKFGTHGPLRTAAAANLLMFTIVTAVFATHGLHLRTVPAPTQNG